MPTNWTKVEEGLNKYLRIMALYPQTDPREDEQFQRLFNGFYRIRQRPKEFYQEYYHYLHTKRASRPSFEETLTHFFTNLNRYEASFSSKLIATINPELPIWDSEVLKNLGLKKPSNRPPERLQQYVNLYNQITKWYNDKLASQEGKAMVEEFDRRFPNVKITNIKKIDFIIWQSR